jgi:hypothetical protein
VEEEQRARLVEFFPLALNLLQNYSDLHQVVLHDYLSTTRINIIITTTPKLAETTKGAIFRL